MKIIIATGGSGGHIFPALFVAEELKKKGADVFFIGNFKKYRSKIVSSYPVVDLPVRGLSAEKGKTFLISFYYMVKSFFQCVSQLRSLKPDAVVGFGGYGSFPVVLAAVCLRIPAMIHEQNVIPGRANTFLARFVKRVAISFKESSSFFQSDKVVLTGCPCQKRPEGLVKSVLLKEFELKQDVFTILVMGGSQGSHRINTEFMRTVALLKNVFSFQVIHLCGDNDYDFLEGEYHQSGISFYLSRFFDNMSKAYCVADLIISRAGAVAVTEIAMWGKPAVFIPYPLAQGHQKKNAAVMEEKGFVQVLEEQDLTPDRLQEVIYSYSSQDENFLDYPKNKNIYREDAALAIVKEVEKLI